MVGLPRSGKTTEAQKLGHPIVCPNAIRLALHGKAFLPESEPMVWTIAKYMVRSLFFAGHDTVILDATNTTVRRREEWKSPEWERRFIWVITSVEECMDRAIKCGFPVKVVKRMSNQFQDLTLRESTRLIKIVGK